MVIATIVILGVGVAQTVSLDLSRSSEETDVAVADLRNALETILTESLEDIPDPGGPFAPGQAIAAFSDLHLDGQRIVATYPNMVGPVAPDPLEIVVTVTWNDFAGRQRTLSMATVKTR